VSLETFFVLVGGEGFFFLGSEVIFVFGCCWAVACEESREAVVDVIIGCWDWDLG
jgi:hypothetical protein